MVTTIIILATLLALVIGVIVGGGLGMHFTAKQTADTISSFAEVLTNDILAEVEEHQTKEREEKTKQMEKAKDEAMAVLDRLERLKDLANPFSRPAPVPGGSLMDAIMRMGRKETPEPPKTDVETMGDHFDELFNQKPEDVPTEPKEEE